jgi:hypothetical protein
MIFAKHFRLQQVNILVSRPKPLLTLRCLAEYPVSVLKTRTKLPLHSQSSEGSKLEQINMQRYANNQSQNQKFGLENTKLRYDQTITL